MFKIKVTYSSNVFGKLEWIIAYNNDNKNIHLKRDTKSLKMLWNQSSKTFCFAFSMF